MPQTAYSLTQASAFAGMKAESRYDLVESFVASKAIGFGLAVGAKAGDNVKVYVPCKDVAVLAVSADFTAGNIITTTVNGVASSAVTFAVDHANTVNLVKASIEAIAGVDAVTLPNTSSVNRDFRIRTDGSVETVSMSISGGTNTQTFTYTYSSDDIFRGVALHTNKEPSAAGVSDAGYKVNDVVNVLKQGKVWVEVGVAVAADDTAYVDIVNGTGKFTNVSSNNLATGGKFRSATAGAGLALLEINNP